jgi:hypothetical protein
VGEGISASASTIIDVDAGSEKSESLNGSGSVATECQ